jgi:hypothetical protein
VTLVSFVIALHWVALEVLANTFKTPSQTREVRQPVLHMQWAAPKAALVSAKSEDVATFQTPTRPQLSALPQQSSDSQGQDASLATSASPKRPEAVGDDEGWNSLHYYSSLEIDTRAAPTIDWAVNRSTMPKGGTVLLIITIWISAVGVVDHFELEQQQPSGDWASAALSSLQTTIMEPATLGGVPVASTMTIEISLNNHDQ